MGVIVRESESVSDAVVDGDDTCESLTVRDCVSVTVCMLVLLIVSEVVAEVDRDRY